MLRYVSMLEVESMKMVTRSSGLRVCSCARVAHTGVLLAPTCLLEASFSKFLMVYDQPISKNKYVRISSTLPICLRSGCEARETSVLVLGLTICLYPESVLTF